MTNTELPATPPTGQGRGPRPLHRGARRIQLIKQLAKGNHTHADLAAQHNVDRTAISQFSRKWAPQIEAHRHILEQELAALDPDDHTWIADRHARLAEYQDDVETINTALATQDDPQLYTHKHRALKQAAEELGHLRQPVDVEHTIYTYRVDGVDTDTLQ